MHDIVIRGGTVVDGTGEAGRTADIAIAGDTIVEVGRVSAPGRREIDADGLLVTPGWVDIHTHYDGQATWDAFLDPSWSSGVTTAMMGNCGVGFAPVRPGSHDRLIELMDGVEEIPGSALHEGLAWNWQSFPEYLDVIDSMPRTFDVAALLPHGPLRVYVLGDAVDGDVPPTPGQIAEMARHADEAMRAGAFGLSSTRTPVHRTASGGMTPDYGADADELLALSRVVAAHGGYMEFAPDGVVGEDVEAIKSEMKLYDRLVRETGVDVQMLVLRPGLNPEYWREQLAWIEGINEGGRSRAFAQVSGRSIGSLLSFFGTHPFMERPTFRRLKAALEREALLAELARPEVKATILAESDPEGTFGHFLNQHWGRCYDIGEEGDYEPDESRNMVTLAGRLGTTPQSATYDVMLENSRHPTLLLAINNYDHTGLENFKELMLRPGSILGASDAGAHVMTICDGSLNTFMLTHWARDRTRGETLPVERVVNMMTQRTAFAAGIHDRGVLRPGLRADVNLIDFDNLRLSSPEVVDDLPDNASRLLQQVTGYRATIVGGTVTREDDAGTGALPGRLLRKNRPNEARPRARAA